MTKREYCQRESVAYYSGFDGLEIKGIEYGINDYIYCVSGAWYGGETNRKCHKLKINYDRSGNAFIKLHGYKISLNECLRMNAI